MAFQARTLAQLVGAVEGLGYTDPDGGVTLNGFVNNEYKTTAGERRWEWLQSTFTFTTVVGTFAYALSSVSPGNVRNMDALWLTDAAHQQYRIQYMQPLKLLDYNQDDPSNITGTPQYWSVWGGQIWFWPTPDQIYTVTAAYTQALADVPLVNPNDRPLLPGDYDMILVWGPAAMMASRMRDWLGRDFYNQQRDRVLSMMRADYQLKQRQNSDSVEQTGIWSGLPSRYQPTGW